MIISNPFSKATTQTNLTSGSDGTVVTQTSQESSSVQGSVGSTKQTETLVPGQTLRGEVVAKNGSEITLKVAGDMVLTARLERDLNLELGKLLTFQVKNNGKVLSLSPLFANMAMESTASKALDVASIPLTDRTLQMASSMMEKGMSVDINSIQNVYKDVATFGNASVEHILRLHQMDVPVTAENIQQLINYENLEHQLSLGVGQVVTELQAEGLDQSMLGQLVTVMGEDAQFSSQPFTAVLTTEELLNLADSLKQMVSVEDVAAPLRLFLEQPQATTLTVKDILTLISQLPSEMAGEDVPVQMSADLPQGMEGAIGYADGAGNGSSNTATNSSLQAGVATAEILSGGLTEPSAFAGHSNSLKDLLGGQIATKLLNALFQDSWTLSPEQVADKQRVLDTYERIVKQLEGLKQAVEGTKGSESSALKSIQNLQSNINFMNHINQMYNYIQIPLTLNGKHTQGELYVYSNKKNLAKADGTVSALLHLDMEHLGPVDVYVTMQNQKVNTNFYLETDELLDFIYDHIYILDEHLAKRGYSLSCKMMQREDATDGKSTFNVMEQIAGEDPEKLVLSQFSFDVRA